MPTPEKKGISLDEAIKLLQKYIDDPGSVDILDLNKAEALGIEALKRLQFIRKYAKTSNWIRLPGETEE
jgi:hypothetical protein